MNLVESITRAIYAEQVDAIFRQMPIALGVNLVNAGLTAAALAPFASQPLPLLWFASVLLVTLGRLVLWLRYRHISARPERSQYFARLATLGSLLAGLSWGIDGATLLPVVPIP